VTGTKPSTFRKVIRKLSKDKQDRLRLSNLPEFGAGVPSEAHAARDSALTDPATSLTKSRVCLEAILKATLSRCGIVIPNATLGMLLQQDRIRKGWPPLILAKMNYVNGITSTMGPHEDTPADAKHAIRVLEELHDILEWCAADLTDNFNVTIHENESLLIYLSRGGTCRCAMANVITRQYLGAWGQTARIRPMSCSLDIPTYTEISHDALAVLRSHYGELSAIHQSRQIDERYVVRADLILAMDSKLLADIGNRWPVLSKDKVFLFSKFFGETGNVDDPHDQGVQAYRDCFEHLDRLIAGGQERLLKQPLA
jgi:protein-tyrosine-phosphatase